MDLFDTIDNPNIGLQDQEQEEKIDGPYQRVGYIYSQLLITL